MPAIRSTRRLTTLRRADARAQARQHLLVEHRLHLAGRAGQQDGERSACSSSWPGAEPRAFGSTSAPSITSGLLQVGVGHRPRVAREARAQAGHDRFVRASGFARWRRRAPRA
jgi:hypothetical protein